jgi:hypothetical protein
VLDGEDDAVVGAGKLLVGDVDLTVEVGVPDWVLRTFPFPSKMIPDLQCNSLGHCHSRSCRHCTHQPWPRIRCR